MPLKKSLPPTSLTLSLIILGQRSIGRYELSKLLNLSIAKTRAILNSLVKHKLAYTKGKSSGKTGTILSKTGQRFYNSLNELFRIQFNPHFISAYTNLVPVGSNPVILLFQSSLESINGLYERDTAVRYGATGAITLIKKDQNWEFPDGFNFENSQLNSLNVPESFNCCVIVYGESLGYSANGAMHIAEYHLYDDIIPIIEPFLL
ncbi:MAG: hypothetical protein GPJ54_20520 [Candidatus Heimdallarchaeota archaeon]|nr:hypothetical protein [Candidatus Heimdallarchaeota archaeon]